MQGGGRVKVFRRRSSISMMHFVWFFILTLNIRRTFAGFEFRSNGAQLILTDIWEMSCLDNITQHEMEGVIDLQVYSSNITLTDMISSISESTNELDLSSLEMMGGYLDTIPENVFLPLGRVSHIMLYEDRIKSLLPRSFCNLTKLYHVDLSNNSITVLVDHTFTHLPVLVEIYLHDNELVTIQDGALFDVPNLNAVYLYNNQLPSIPYKTLANSSITYLYLSNNEITEVTHDILLLKHLVILDISRNQVEFVSGKIAELGDLSILYLYNNNITTLPGSMELMFNRLIQIDVTSNPWNCNCSLAWLVLWSQRQNNTKTGYQLECSTPFRINMSYVDTDTLNCGRGVQTLNNKLVTFFIMVPVFILVVIVGTLCFIRERARLFRKTRHFQMVCDGLYYRSRVADSRTTVVTRQHEDQSDDLEEDVNQDAGFTGVNEYGTIKLGKVIGRGAFGDVFEATASTGNDRYCKVAVKKLRAGAAVNDHRCITEEFQNLKEIGCHPNIINVLGSGILNGSVIMVMELAKHGDLLTNLQTIGRLEHQSIHNLDHLEEKGFLQTRQPCLYLYMWHVAKGMEYLSRLKVVHRDLAARNILISEGPIAKISDFGLSRDVYESGYYYQDSSGRLPYKWLSPETLSVGKSTIKSDVWSYGVLLWEIVTLGGSPYPGIPPNTLLDMLNMEYRMRQPTLCPDHIYEVMLKCWKLEPDDRLGFDCIVDLLDKFIQQGTNKEYFDVSHHDNTPIFDVVNEQKTPIFGQDLDKYTLSETESLIEPINDEFTRAFRTSGDGNIRGIITSSGGDTRDITPCSDEDTRGIIPNSDEDTRILPTTGEDYVTTRELILKWRTFTNV